jgi:SAM-dependent methyltransferase
VDAPLVLFWLVAAAVVGVAAVVVLLALGWWAGWLAAPVAAYLVLSAASYAYTTLRGKFVVWAREVDRLGLTGVEQAVDLGCGRGAVLVLVAQALPRGRAIGVDLWRSADQSGNLEEAAQRNLAAARVSADLITADLRALPLETGAYDLVVSSLAIHNIPGPAGRAQAVAEAYRVLAPGGRLLLADLLHLREYAAVLTGLGATDVTIRTLGWRFWYGAPWFATRLLTLQKAG